MIAPVAFYEGLWIIHVIPLGLSEDGVDLGEMAELNLENALYEYRNV